MTLELGLGQNKAVAGSHDFAEEVNNNIEDNDIIKFPRVNEEL